MSFIGKNIKKIRAVKKMSQSDFAQLFNLARPSVGAYEEGRAEPKIETVIQIAHHFELSIDTLLTKELTINELMKFDIFKNDINKDRALLNEDRDEIKEQTPLVTIDKFLDYLVNYKNKDYINNLPVIQFPFTEVEKSRAFQVEGNQMQTDQYGIYHKDILLCQAIEIDKPGEFKDDMFVIVTKDAIRVRRLSSYDDGKFFFKPDNPIYEDLNLSSKEILELWRVKAFFSRHVQKPALLEERVIKLERQMSDLLKKS